MTNIKDNRKVLKRQLDLLYKTFDLKFLATDPLEFVHRYKTPEDREIVGLVSSCLAYGRVETIKKSIEAVMCSVGPSPYRFTMRFDPVRDSSTFEGFIHRFNNGRDIRALFYFMRQMIEKAGSIKGFFLKGYSSGDKNVKGALVSFSSNALALDSVPVYKSMILPPKAGVRFFFPSPSDNSACKRLNLYLRWMVRRGDALDFGIWKEVDPARLVMPLDTHIARISRNIGLTSRATPDWKMAEEITTALAAFDPSDPVKYDFALCRLGILDKCPANKDRAKCESCLIKKLCVL